MKFLSGIWQIVADLSLRAKTIFVFCVLFIVAGYFFFDRYLDYREAVPDNAEWLKEWKENKKIDTEVVKAGGSQ